MPEERSSAKDFILSTSSAVVASAILVGLTHIAPSLRSAWSSVPMMGQYIAYTILMSLYVGWQVSRAKKEIRMERKRMADEFERKQEIYRYNYDNLVSKYKDLAYRMRIYDSSVRIEP